MENYSKDNVLSLKIIFQSVLLNNSPNASIIDIIHGIEIPDNYDIICPYCDHTVLFELNSKYCILKKERDID